MNKKHVVRAAGIYASIVAGIFLILVGFNWYMLKQELVQRGFARPNFPYVKYNQEELNKLFPQYPLENVLTTQTPEETYAKFIAALKKGDVEATIFLFDEKKRIQYREQFEELIIKNKLEDFVKKLDHSLLQIQFIDPFAQYKVTGVKENYIIEFIKNADGVWRIDSL